MDPQPWIGSVPNAPTTSSTSTNAPSSVSRHIIIAARVDMPQANALAIELRRLGFQAALASDVRSYLPYASAVVVMLSATSLYEQPVVLAVSARPTCLIPVLLDDMPLPPGPWTTQAIAFRNDPAQAARQVIYNLGQAVQQHPELARAATPPAPQSALAPVVQRPAQEYHYVSNAGSGVVALTGAVAVISFFALPYIDAGLLGSYTGAQVANLISSVYSAASSSYNIFSTSQPTAQSGFNPALFIWAEALLAAIAVALSAWQWFATNDSGDPPRRGVVIGVLIATLLSALILLYQFVGLQSSSIGQAVASVLGFGYWLMLLAMLCAVGGAIAQLRAFAVK